LEGEDMSGRDPFGRLIADARAGGSDARSRRAGADMSSDAYDDAPARGWCEPALRSELPGLALMSTAVELGGRRSPTGASPPAVMAQLHTLSNRWRGARAVGVRQEPVPAAYRVFFRQIGLDPDRTRTPVEQAVLARMLQGGFVSRGLLADVITLALMDTAVPLWALDADTIDGELGIRASRPGERLGRAADGASLGGGRLVVVDEGGVLAILFDQPAAEHRPRRSTRRLVLYAVQVAGVPALHVEETLWACRAALVEACSGH
jgi:DNA/RNA-binding domain of Phe-tRNA-synthetase-like protein